jgi:MFS transporter, DHA1 family, multidrug resistance protein
MQDYLGRSASEFGRYFVLLPIGFLCGNIVSSRLSGRARIETMVMAGCTVMAIALCAQAIIVLAGYLNPLIIFIPGFLLTFSQGLALANAQTGALRMAGKSAGAAAGLGVFCQMFFGALGAQLFTTIADGTPTPMVITVLLGTALTVASGLYAYVTRPRT